MKAAIVLSAGATPVSGEMPLPHPGEGEHLIKVSASAVSQVVKARASGMHYSATDQYPFVIGVDGVGSLDDGSRVYFALPSAPNGCIAEYTVAKKMLCVPLPDGLDAATAAAIANPGMSSWAALTERARLKPGEVVLINGATGTSGRLAVQIAKHLGAGKIIATGRNPDALRELAALGADTTIQLSENPKELEQRFMQEFTQGVDIVIDYLWGESAESILIAAAKTGKDAKPMRFVQVGSISGENITLPSAVLRATAIELMGSGNGSVAIPRLIEIIGELFAATVPSGFEIAFKPVPFAEFDDAWALDNSTHRTVFTFDSGASK